MTPAQLYQLFRADVRDDVAPYLWSDLEVYSYMHDAQEMFCRFTGGISDEGTPFTTLPVTAGWEYVAYSDRILKIKTAWRDDGTQLRLLNPEDLHSDAIQRDYGFDLGHNMNIKPGPVKALVSGFRDNYLKLVYVPTTDFNINLSVFRLPNIPITDGTSRFEIASHHHRHLLLWMKHLAYMKQDAETFDKERSDDMQQEFMRYCDRAKMERERREHKYRVTSYGGY